MILNPDINYNFCVSVFARVTVTQCWFALYGLWSLEFMAKTNSHCRKSWVSYLSSK